ncbi:HDIG domain-containing protein [candidate division TA06 bacterium]|uniref:HDIG domain-containing protein n=1 Tax=candidate division TA06 bacterium TaxID=2250710 RepID=A0A933ML54_UNCT6|nr:HDIG domain-containing protein [candidate division TA06 bacterium]
MPANIIQAINSFGRLYEVGGAVRDRIRHSLDSSGNIDPERFSQYQPVEADYLVAGIPMDQLARLLKQFGRVELVGRSFGVIKFKVQNENCKLQTFDIALPRKEQSIGPGHKDFAIEYDPGIPIELDLGRRDFAVNAIALRIQNSKFKILNSELLDPYDGLQDIKNKLIRMVSKNTFAEDPLRMLRACQFAARLRFSIEQDTFKAIKKNAGLISTVSPERVQQELNKMLLSDQPSVGFWLMQRSGLLKILLPELEQGADVSQPGGCHRYKVFEHSIKSSDFAPKTLELRLTALLHDVAKPRCREVFEGGAHFYGHDKLGAKMAGEILSRLKYSNQVIERVTGLIGRHMFAVPETGKGLRRLISKAGIDGLDDLIALRRADIMAQGMKGDTEYLKAFKQAVKEELDKKPAFSIKDLKIDGNDLMKELGLGPGPKLGRILKQLFELALENPKNNHKTLLLKEARRLAAQLKYSRQDFYS